MGGGPILGDVIDRGHHSRTPVIVTGAGGWIGRNALEATKGRPVVPVVANPRILRMSHGPLAAIAPTSLLSLEAGLRPLIVHAGFPTQDRVDALGDSTYREMTAEIRKTMLSVISRCRPVDMVYISSGAAAGVERGERLAHRTEVYGQEKLADEAAFFESVTASSGRLCTVRAYALSGPFMTKPEIYALGNMIFQAARRGAVEVKAARPVRRSYMAIDDMLRIAMHAVERLDAGQAISLETAGEVVEMGDLAARVLGVMGRDPLAVVRPDFDPDAPPADYLGNPEVVGRLSEAAGVVPASLDDQIAVTADWLRSEYRL